MMGCGDVGRRLEVYMRFYKQGGRFEYDVRIITSIDICTVRISTVSGNAHVLGDLAFQSRRTLNQQPLYPTTVTAPHRQHECENSPPFLRRQEALEYATKFALRQALSLMNKMPCHATNIDAPSIKPEVSTSVSPSCRTSSSAISSLCNSAQPHSIHPLSAAARLSIPPPPGPLPHSRNRTLHRPRRFHILLLLNPRSVHILGLL